MKGVGARLQRHVHDAAGGPAVLRVVGVRLHLELLHRIGWRHVGDVVAALVRVVGRAVEQEFVVAVLAAVHRKVGQCAVVERTEVDGLRVVGDAGDQRRERYRAARLERQLRDARLIDDRAAIGLARFEQRRFGRDVDALGYAAHAELRVDDGDLTDFEPHVGPVVLLESAHLNRQRYKGRDGGTGWCSCHRCSSMAVATSLVCWLRTVTVAPGSDGLARIDNLAFDRGPELLGGRAADHRQKHCDDQHALTRLHSHHSVSSNTPRILTNTTGADARTGIGARSSAGAEMLRIRRTVALKLYRRQ